MINGALLLKTIQIRELDLFNGNLSACSSLLFKFQLSVYHFSCGEDSPPPGTRISFLDILSRFLLSKHVFAQLSHEEMATESHPPSSILCHFARGVCVFFTWNGGLKGSRSDSSICMLHSSLIMLHKGEGNPSVVQNFIKPPFK